MKQFLVSICRGGLTVETTVPEDTVEATAGALVEFMRTMQATYPELREHRPLEHIGGYDGACIVNDDDNFDEGRRAGFRVHA